MVSLRQTLLTTGGQVILHVWVSNKQDKMGAVYNGKYMGINVKIDTEFKNG